MQEVAKARSKVRLCIVEVAPGWVDHAWITSDYLGSWWIISDYLGSCLTWQQVSNQHWGGASLWRWLYRGGWGSETSLDKEAAARQDTAALLCSPASGPMVAVLLVDLPQRCNAFPAALKRCRSFRVSAVQAHLAVLLWPSSAKRNMHCGQFCRFQRGNENEKGRLSQTATNLQSFLWLFQTKFTIKPMQWTL